MKTNSNASKRINQAFSTDYLLERDRLNKERYRQAKFEQAIAPKRNRTLAESLDSKYQKLAPMAKMILNELDSRNLKWSVNPFNQQWLANSCKCSLRWVRHCIALLAEQGFIAIVRINRGKPYKTLDGWFKYPNIYIVSPFIRWANSAKLYALIAAKAEKIQAQFLYYKRSLITYYKCRSTLGIKTPFSEVNIDAILKKMSSKQFSTA